MEEVLKNMDISYIPSAQTQMKPIHEHASEAVKSHGIGIGVDVLSRHLYVFVWIINSRLGFRIIYNEAYYNRSIVGRILILVKKHLVSNLISSSSTACQ